MDYVEEKKKKDDARRSREYRERHPDRNRKSIHKYWRNKIIRELIIEGIVEENKQKETK